MSRRRKQAKETTTPDNIGAKLAAECEAGLEEYFQKHGEYPSVSPEQAAQWGAAAFAALKPKLDENQRIRDEAMAFAFFPAARYLRRRRRRREE